MSFVEAAPTPDDPPRGGGEAGGEAGRGGRRRLGAPIADGARWLLARLRAPSEAAAGRALAIAAVVVAAAAAAWGIDAIFPDGHAAASACIGTAGHNMWKYGIVFPVTNNPGGVPSVTQYYMHHPLGLFWVTALFMKVLGEHNWVVRLPPLLYSTLTPLFLFRLGATLWGPLAGGVTALAFVALPMSLGFGNHNGLELPVIFGCVVGTWGYARLAVTGRERYAIASLAGLAFAVINDWAAYFCVGFLAALVFARAFVLPARSASPSPSARAAGRYFGGLVLIVAVSVALEVKLLASTGKLTELFSMYGFRSAGNELPIAQVLAGRRTWIQMMFPRLAIGIGKLGLAVIVLRWIVRRSQLEALALPLFGMALLQYVHFKSGADYHIFWPQHFAPYFALAAGALVRTFADGARATIARAGASLPLRDRLPRLAAALARWRERPGAVALAAALPMLVALGFVLRDGVEMLRLGRETGGRYNAPLVQNDIDQVVALKWFLARFPPDDHVAFHPGFPATQSINWEIRPHFTEKGQALGSRGPQPTRAYVLDTRTTPAGDLRRAAAEFHVAAVGPIWLIDRTAPWAPIDGYRLDEREPRFWQWLRYDTEPVREVRADAGVTWEWRNTFDQKPMASAAPPAAPPPLQVLPPAPRAPAPKPQPAVVPPPPKTPPPKVAPAPKVAAASPPPKTPPPAPTVAAASPPPKTPPPTPISKVLPAAPAAPPSTGWNAADELRIAHNMALARGDMAGATAALAALRRRLDVGVSADFADNFRIVGALHHRGAERYLWIVMQAGVSHGDLKLSVRAQVLGQPWYSTLPVHTDVIEIAFPPPIPTSLWRQGYLYAVKVPYRKRPGIERYEARFASIDGSPAPLRTDGGPQAVKLVTVR